MSPRRMWPHGTLRRRPTGIDDGALLRVLFLTARPERGWLPAPLQDLQFRAFSASLAAFGPTSDDILLLGDEGVGRLVLRADPDAVRVLEIAVLPEFRSRGIGGAVLAGVIGDARNAEQTATLSVASDNPARRLYERLGFRAVSETGADVELRWDGSDGADANHHHGR